MQTSRHRRCCGRNSEHQFGIHLNHSVSSSKSVLAKTMRILINQLIFLIFSFILITLSLSSWGNAVSHTAVNQKQVNGNSLTTTTTTTAHRQQQHNQANIINLDNLDATSSSTATAIDDEQQRVQQSDILINSIDEDQYNSGGNILVFGTKTKLLNGNNIPGTTLLNHRHRYEPSLSSTSTPAPTTTTTSTTTAATATTDVSTTESPQSTSTQTTTLFTNVEQQPMSEQQQQQQQQQQQHFSNELQKLEARNEHQSQEIGGDASNSSNFGEPIILDHRPLEHNSELVQIGASTQAPISDYSPTSSSATTMSTTTTAPTTQNSFSAGNTILQAQQQQQPQSSSSQHAQVGGGGQWQAGHNGVIYYAQQQQPIQQQQFNPMMSGSNQVALKQQYPTSINSIISEQQQQLPAATTTTSAIVTNNGNGAVGAAALGSNGQQILSLSNGQATPVILLGQSAANAGQITTLNGRRTSISNWFRGLSTMLANIFNRREHGAIAGQQMQTSGSSPAGHWIQLGPNAPHWLTQAQSAIQQLQQASSGVVPNRFATLIQAPAQFIQQQAASVANSVAINNVASPLGSQIPSTINGGGGGGSNQQIASSAATLQAQPTSASLTTIALPQSNANYQRDQQQQLQQPVGVQFVATSGSGDLQTSGSSMNYLTIQQAPVGVVMQQQQANHLPVTQSTSYSQAATLSNGQTGQTQLIPVGQQQQQVQQSSATIQNQSTGTTKSMTMSNESNSRQQQQAISSNTLNNGNNNLPQQSAASTSVATNHAHQARFGRPSASSASSTGQQQQATISIASKNAQSNSNFRSQTTSGGNLPLAHYSTQYSMSTE